MTSRRCILLEEGVREFLELNHYTIHVVPIGYNRRLPPSHLVATRGPDETRYIRIKKVSRHSKAIPHIETNCRKEIIQYRKMLDRSAGKTGLHCEIWIYTLWEGYRCFEVLKENVREIPQLPPDYPVSASSGGVA